MTWSMHDHERRLEDAYDRLGTREPRCSTPNCDERNPLTLTGTYPDILCYECRVRSQGRSWIERHHPDGQHNNPDVVPVPGNDHRILSDRQRDWPEATFHNVHSSPLLKAAAALRGWLDVMDLLIYRIVGWIPDFLEWLDGTLCDVHGPHWWLELGWEEQS